MSWLIALRSALEAEGFTCELKEERLRGRYVAVRHGIGASFAGGTVYEDGLAIVGTAPLDHPIWRAVELARECWASRDEDGS